MKKLIPLTIALLAIPALSLCAADGKALYEKDCTKCHGADGKGDTKMGKKYGAKDYTDAKVQAELKDADLTKAIADGVFDAGKEKMKAYKGELSAAEITDLVAYIRKFKG